MTNINQKIGVWLLDTSNTKSDLAEALGMTTRTLKNRINGDYEWTWPEVCKLADILGCTLQELRD